MTPFRSAPLVGLLIFMGLSPALLAQGTRADYQRANALGERFRNKVVRDRVEPHWVSPTRFWYKNELPGDTDEFVLVDAEQGTRETAATRDELPLNNGEKPDERLDEGPKAPSPDRPRFGDRPQSRSPDKQVSVALRDRQLVLKRGDAETLLTTDGAEDNALSDRVYWSPDSKYFVALQTKAGGDRRVTLVESSPKDQVQPKIKTLAYLKPGDAIRQPRPRLFCVEEARELPIKDAALFENPWDIKTLRWAADSSGFTFFYNQRGHQTLRIVRVDAPSGEARAVIEESSPTFVDYAGKFFCCYLDDTNEILWMSERDGWNHLYLIDAGTGEVKNQVTRGPYAVRGVDWVDPERRQVWLHAGGVYAHQDPYYVHYCRVDFDGKNLTRLTEGDGTHAVKFSPDRRWLIDTYSRVDMAPVTELRSAEDGSLVCELERGDLSALQAELWRAPERFVAKGRDGKTDIYGIICRPTHFDPAKKYPVIEEHYAGPHSAFVPKGFAPLHRSQEFAELGFIVVQVDGMGTSHRSKAFHDACWRNLADGGFPDRIAWMKAAAQNHPEMDLTRVGIRGTSAGGQTAMAALWRHGDFYKAAVSNCGCHDNRMDKIWWNELWMGWPVGPHYAEQSNVTHAGKIEGDLLLIVGEMDDNVPPESTLQVVNALIEADKDFEFLLVPGKGHGAGGPYTQRKTMDFFVRKLLGVEPRAE
ncbi:Prolyl tripeptidyl peptidase precursor [Pirellulimonas nuda]|uniref:Prolyl tripeptidyl peptidase n=1 Tax=Pirellulimonas nuda TaxID=2528009 RepID=A0A518D822_9BACT|nr:prolyl oligopeptidase family serine peptidase [Pirellulimonas nuda]QDU87631.1 Prolyl tripeptidyl peptidase precursor [Pirellulimonas nuda]